MCLATKPPVAPDRASETPDLHLEQQSNRRLAQMLGGAIGGGVIVVPGSCLLLIYLPSRCFKVFGQMPIMTEPQGRLQTDRVCEGRCLLGHRPHEMFGFTLFISDITARLLITTDIQYDILLVFPLPENPKGPKPGPDGVPQASQFVRHC